MSQYSHTVGIEKGVPMSFHEFYCSHLEEVLGENPVDYTCGGHTPIVAKDLP